MRRTSHLLADLQPDELEAVPAGRASIQERYAQSARGGLRGGLWLHVVRGVLGSFVPGLLRTRPQRPASTGEEMHAEHVRDMLRGAVEYAASSGQRRAVRINDFRLAAAAEEAAHVHPPHLTRSLEVLQHDDGLRAAAGAPLHRHRHLRHRADTRRQEAGLELGLLVSRGRHRVAAQCVLPALAERHVRRAEQAAHEDLLCCCHLRLLLPPLECEAAVSEAARRVARRDAIDVRQASRRRWRDAVDPRIAPRAIAHARPCARARVVARAAGPRCRRESGTPRRGLGTQQRVRQRIGDHGLALRTWVDVVVQQRARREVTDPRRVHRRAAAVPQAARRADRVCGVAEGGLRVAAERVALEARGAQVHKGRAVLARHAIQRVEDARLVRGCWRRRCAPGLWRPRPTHTGCGGGGRRVAARERAGSRVGVRWPSSAVRRRSYRSACRQGESPRARRGAPGRAAGMSRGKRRSARSASRPCRHCTHGGCGAPSMSCAGRLASARRASH
eukprot:scaffold74913_cov59-Phaeocystis_antarctica.AAC.5